MRIDEAIVVLKDFCRAFENVYDYYKLKNGKSETVELEYVATKVLLQEYENLRKEVVQLAIESIKRDVALAKLQYIVSELEKK